MALHVFLDIHLLEVQILGDAQGQSLILVEESALQIKCIRQAMGDVERNDQSPVALFRRCQTGRGRDGRFAYAAFT